MQGVGGQIRRVGADRVEAAQRLGHIGRADARRLDCLGAVGKLRHRGARRPRGRTAFGG